MNYQEINNRLQKIWPKINFSQAPFGLDFSNDCLRLIQLTKNRGKKPSIKTYGQINLEPGIIVNGEIKDPAKLSEAIKQLLAKTTGEKINTKEVVADLPETKTFIKMVTFNWPTDNELTQLATAQPVNKNSKKKGVKLKDQILHQILVRELADDVPINLAETTLDYHILRGNLKTIKLGEEMKLLVGIAPKKIAEEYAKVIEDAGLLPVALEIEGAAIVRSIIKKTENKNKLIENPTKIIVDLGASRTGLIIVHNDSIRYSLSVPISGNNITQQIADVLKINFNEAEKIKSQFDLTKIAENTDEKNEVIKKIITTDLTAIISRIKEGIFFCQLKISAKEKPGLVICGGGANWPGLKDYLGQQLQLKVIVADPWVNLNNQPADFPSGETLSYTTAIGLALGGIYDYS